ncbi:glycosyltransferase family 39 protein, partial [Candidatus Sumerlaeota bacterium]|nr:glycosyltransferase family 39 protein [Candidatus Sumerlaeota bacterium]
MKTIKAEKQDYFFLGLIFLVFFLLLFSIWQDDYIDNVFYYYYLSSFLFDGDVDILNDYFLSNNSFLIFKSTYFGVGPKGLLTNLFAIGSAVLWFPFLLLVRLFALIVPIYYPYVVSWISDRYSYPYRAAISFGTLFYGLLTLFLIYAICRTLFRRRTSFWASLGVVFASPLPAYIFHYSSMSHTLSAFSVALLVYLSIRHRHFRSLHSYILIGGVVGLATLVRWQNIIFLLIPLSFVIQHFRQLYKKERIRIRKHIRYLVVMLVVIIATFSLQMFYWYAQLGNFLTVPQGKGFLRWTSPVIGKVLFSGWHGLYYCHPLLFLATLGLLLLFIRCRLKLFSLTLILCFVLLTYINAIANDWFAGNSFGARRFCSLIPVLGIGLAAFLDLFRHKWRFIVPILILTAIVMNFLFLIVFLRGIFDFYFLEEIFNFREQILRVLPAFLGTLHLNSRIFIAILMDNATTEGIALALIGGFIVFSTLLLIEKNFFVKLEKKSLLLFVFFIIGVFILNALMFFRAPEPDKGGLLFRQALLDSTPPKQKEQIITKLLKYKWRNPLIYLYTYIVLRRTDLVPEMLDALYEISPRLWAKWVNWLPLKYVGVENRRRAAIFKTRPVAPTMEDIFDKRLEKLRAERQKSAVISLLKEKLKYKPFDAGTIKEMIDIYEKKLKNTLKVHQLETELRKILELRLQNYLRHEDAVRPFHFIVLGGNIERFKLLGKLYEKHDDLLKAKRLYDAMYSRTEDPYFSQRSLLVEAKLEKAEPEKVVDEIFSTSETVLSETILTLAEFCLERKKLSLALKVLITGLNQYPYDYELQKKLIKVLKEYQESDIPINRLMSEKIESPLYWPV